MCLKTFYSKQCYECKSWIYACKTTPHTLAWCDEARKKRKMCKRLKDLEVAFATIETRCVDCMQREARRLRSRDLHKSRVEGVYERAKQMRWLGQAEWKSDQAGESNRAVADRILGQIAGRPEELKSVHWLRRLGNVLPVRILKSKSAACDNMLVELQEVKL